MAVTVTFDTGTLTEREAGAVASLLLAVHPDALDAAARHLNQPLLPGVEHTTAVDNMRVTIKAPDAETLKAVMAEATLTSDPAEQAALAPMPEIDAAAAFGGAGPLADTTQTQLTDAAAAFGGTVQSGGTGGAVTADPAPSGTGDIAPPSASPSSGVQLDSTGLPYDKRIHSDPPTITGKGVWRKKRSLNQLVEQQVIAELRATYPEPLTAAQRTAQEAVSAGLMPPEAGAPIPPAPAPAPAPAPVAVAPPPPSDPIPAASTGPVPSPSAAPPPPAADPDDATPPATQFAAAMTLATAAQTAGQITLPETQAIVTNLGLAQMRDLLLPANTHLIAAFRAGVQAHIDARPNGGAA